MPSVRSSLNCESLEHLIRDYFFAGYTYTEIMAMLLCRHGISISLRQLNRKLRVLGLRRQKNIDREVVQALQYELSNGGSSLGYRSMARRLASRHGLIVPRHCVSTLLRNMDPEGVERRRKHQFSRRIYTNEGPNFLIHIDGYDKLKRYGFAIHGAICGFSRRVLWLKVANTNNDPWVIAMYFMEYVNEIQGVPRCIRMDGGTENVLVQDIQIAFRWENTDPMAAEKSVIIGSSHSNQRIERWWRSVRESGMQFWINLCKDLESSGLFSIDNEMHIEYARFCFMELIQKELDLIRTEWNQHKVRKCSNSESQGGKPDMMFYMPTLYGAVDYKVSVNQQDLEQVTRFCQVPFHKGCREEILVHISSVMSQRRLQVPTTAHEALTLYGYLLNTLAD